MLHKNNPQLKNRRKQAIDHNILEKAEKNR